MASTALHTLSSAVAIAASGPGALDGHEVRCSCGFAARSSLRTLAVQDAHAHIAWAVRKGGRA